MLPDFSGGPEARAAHSAEVDMSAEAESEEGAAKSSDSDVAAEAEPEAGTGAELGVGPEPEAEGGGGRGAGHPTNSRILGAAAAAAAVASTKTVTATLSGCIFRPALPQRDPAVPWADGRSETEASPFLFVLDGGTVELLSPVFEAAGQAFVAQVRLVCVRTHHSIVDLIGDEQTVDLMYCRSSRCGPTPFL